MLPTLSEDEISDAVNDSLVWCSLNGLIIGNRKSTDFGETPGVAITHAPVTLVPTPFPKRLFEQAISLATLFNELTDAVSLDTSFLRETLAEAAKSDDFTARLLDIHHKVIEEGAAQDLFVGMHRSDYMADTASGKLLQIELNTISTSFPGLSSRVTDLHRYILDKYGHKFRVSGTENIPGNSSAESMAEALALAWKEAGDDTASVLMVVQSPEANQYDQHCLSLSLWTNHRVPVVRKTLAQIHSEADIEADRTLTINGKKISVVYFRAGYGPGDYPTEKEWSARLLIERSRAAKCPSVAYQLAGAKKVQQELARPGVLERFVSDADSAARIRETFAGLWALDPSQADSQAAIAAAMEEPDNFVLKPQREGGGNNIYGHQVAETLKKLLESSPSLLGSYILMQRIFPDEGQKTVMIRSGQWSFQKTVSELGIYSVYLRNKDRVVLNKPAGHLLRTKSSASDEGGVASGYAVLDSPYLE